MANASRIAVRITDLETTQSKLDKYPVDEVTVGDKKFKLAEARVHIAEELRRLYSEQDILNGDGGFQPVRFQERVA